MVNDSTTDEEARRIAAQAVLRKFHDLMEQREAVVRERSELERRIRNLDRGLFDCRAAGRLFGVEITLPDDVRPALIAPRPRSSFAAPPLPPPLPLRLPVEMPASLADIGAAEAADSGATIRDLVLDRLKSAGASGIKARAIRKHVEGVLNRQIHYKTIGMTLYRLSTAEPPLVRREGYIWFFVPPKAETKNPGTGMPG